MILVTRQRVLAAASVSQRWPVTSGYSRSRSDNERSVCSGGTAATTAHRRPAGPRSG